MADQDRAQIYLATPRHPELSTLPGQLAGLLDRFEIACIRVIPDSADEDRICRLTDAVREVAHARDVAVVLDEHFRLVDRLGIDGVHLVDAARQVRDVRKLLGPDAVVGSYCGASRHAGMTAAEIGADYVALGPVTASAALGDGKTADPDLFQWWSEMIETPVVAEGGLGLDAVRSVAPFADFLCLQDEVWSADNPADALAAIIDALG
ncbi:thiamine phosphate synthase [Oceanomicrobium pacificus]|uniref:Thiamine phosphate synthase n=1 Tax=Oceanomicrobium pacificus TaxID=2692916 RepID=A0A6B0TYQ3_9RHOB|nr:thiamine phosphate synthase [Oceanomicrobium pacificus]MXU66154.1 thiamine phosphate synthase [Oceanomicrobium pacificus]